MTFSSPKQSAALVFKVLLFVLSLWFIYYRVIEKENFDDVVRDIKQIITDSNSVALMIISFVLMLINWSLEAIKWRLLVNKITRISFLKSLRAVLSGVTFSLFTPNRMGEFAGRIVHLPHGTRIKAALVTVLGNLSQFAITFFAGSIACIYFSQFFEINSWLLLLLVFLLLFLNLLLLLFFFKISIIEKWLLKIKFIKNIEKHIEAIAAYSKNELLGVLGLSLIRYLVFATQYVIMLKAMQVEASWYLLYLPVAMVFMLITVVPTIALTELALRTSVAAAVIGLVSGNTIGILEASFMVWFINLVIPSLAGTFTLFALKLFRAK